MRFFYLLLLVCFVGAASAQTDNKVLISFDHRAAGQPLVLQQTLFSIWNGKKVKLTRAEFYLAELSIRRPDNTLLALTDQYILANANAPDVKHDMGMWPVSAASGMSLHIGVPFAANHSDPASYKAEHPLSPKDPSMHWGWSAGYRFMAIEGFVDNNNDGIPEDEFEYHNLGDALYTTLEVTGSSSAANGILDIRITLDYARLFESLPMTGNLFQHGSASVNKTMMTNAAQQGFMKMAASSSVTALVQQSEQVHISPNPFANGAQVQYEMPTTQPLNLTIVNAAGQTLRQYTRQPASGTLRVEKNELPQGTYHLCFWEESRLLARKPFLIQE